MPRDQYTMQTFSDTLPGGVGDGRIDIGTIDGTFAIDADGTNYAKATFPVELDLQLGYMANAVIVDNFTNQYIEIPSAERFVQPLAVGVVIPFTASSQKARARFSPPPGRVQSPIVTGQLASITFTSDRLAPTGVGTV